MQMRSFEKMAKEKKVKVLTLVIFLCIINWFSKVKAFDVPKLMHIIRDGVNGLEGVCIASKEDAYLATDWTYPIAKECEDLPQIVTYFLPNQTSEYDCNFEEDQHCAEKWKSNIWRIPENSDKTYEAIFDYRWEDFKIHLITKNTSLVAKRIDIQHNFNITLSIRSDHAVEVWLCEGWLPEKHACYTILLGSEDGKSVILNNTKNKTLATYKAEEFVMSFDKWESFQLSLSPSGIIRVFDLTKNVDLLKFQDETPLKPIYLFMHSEMPSLWKLHQNNFLYTDVSVDTPFGPVFNMSSTNLCISMFVEMCESCNLSFYLKNGDEKGILLQINGTNLNKWKHVRLFVKRFNYDTLQLFTKTEGPDNAYWMMDNIRLCSPSEVKVTVLKNSNNTYLDMSNFEISCHALSSQLWRPKPYRMKPDVGSPQITKHESNTSVTLSWKPLQIYNNELPFIVKYQGHHLCPGNYTLKNVSLQRIKSKGIMLVNGSEVIINNLVPYTHYSFNFIHPVYKNLSKEFEVDTNETENITEFERPRNIYVRLTSTSVTLDHEVPSCNDLHGRILYNYSICDLQPTISESTKYIYKGLQPFTNYTLKIETSRSLTGLKSSNRKSITYYNFTTKPSVAPPVSQLNIVETTKNSISLGYKLPNITMGIPELVYVTYCNGLLRNKCNFMVENITKCDQYPDMFCIRITKLIRNERYKFKLSIKNKQTHTNGEDTVIIGSAVSNVPGEISNLTYAVIDCSESHEYCNFNISWKHPYENRDHNGAVTAFEIELEVGANKGLADILLIKNREYKPKYYHVIRYLPYATTYNISVRAINEDYKGKFSTIQGKTDHIGEHIDQIPDIVEVTPYNVVVHIPSLDARIDKAVLTVIVQSMVTQHIDEDMWKIANNNLCFEVAETWLAKVLELTKLEDTTFVVGDGKLEFSELYNRSVLNKELLPDTDYCLTYVIQNTYKDIVHTKVYHWPQRTSSALPEAHDLPNNTFKVLMVLLTLVVFSVIIGLILYRYRNRLHCRKVSRDVDHIYEAMPFDEYNDVPNVVYNVTYDKLIHD